MTIVNVRRPARNGTYVFSALAGVAIKSIANIARTVLMILMAGPSLRSSRPYRERVNSRCYADMGQLNQIRGQARRCGPRESVRLPSEHVDLPRLLRGPALFLGGAGLGLLFGEHPLGRFELPLGARVPGRRIDEGMRV